MEHISKIMDSMNGGPQQTRSDFVWHCEDCGQTVEPFEWTMGEQVRFIQRQFCDCAAGQAKAAAQEEVISYQEWKRAAEDLIVRAGLNDDVLGQFRFNNWERAINAPHSTRQIDAVENYVNQITDSGKNWLWLYGKYGIGKTHLAVAAVRKIAAVHLWEPHIVVWAQLCNLTKEAWSSTSGPNEAQLWGKARAARILLIDDLDKTATSEWAMSKLLGLINERYNRGQKITIITANSSVDELMRRWGASGQEHVRDTGNAVLSRVAGRLVGQVHFQGDDYRLSRAGGEW